MTPTPPPIQPPPNVWNGRVRRYLWAELEPDAPPAEPRSPQPDAVDDEPDAARE